MYWYPNTEYSGRHNLKVVCGRQIWNVPISFKSVLPKVSRFQITSKFHLIIDLYFDTIGFNIVVSNFSCIDQSQIFQFCIIFLLSFYLPFQKTKKKATTTLVKKISPSLRKSVSKTASKHSTASSKDSTRKQPIWNDKPYIPKKSNKENVNINEASEQFCSPSKISFNICSPENIRRFTYAVNKIGSVKENSPVLNDSLEIPKDSSPRLSLERIQLNTSILDDVCMKKLGLDSISYLGTPINQFFHPPKSSSVLLPRDQTDKNVGENPRVIRNLSFELNYGMQPKLNIGSETRIIGNLSSDSLRNYLDDDTYIKNNASTRACSKGDKTFEMIKEKNSLNLINKCSKSSLDSNRIVETQNKSKHTSIYNIPRGANFLNNVLQDGNHEKRSNEQYINLKNDYINAQKLNSSSPSSLNISSGTYTAQESRFDQSCDSFVDQLRQLDEQNLSSRTYVKDEHSFEQSELRFTNYSNRVLRDTDLKSNQEYLECYSNGRNSSENRLKEKTSSKIFKGRYENSPKKGIEVFPTENNFSPTIILNDDHNLYPIKEEPTDESLIRTQIKRKSNTKFAFSPMKRQNLSPESWSKVNGKYNTQTMVTKQSVEKNIDRRTSFLNGAKSVTYVEKKTMTITDPFILAATTAIDPFLTNTIYLDQEWIQKQEERFKNWLNMLLTPPSDLDVSLEGQRIDAAKLWRECSQKDVSAAPTKEEICIKYHTSTRLDTLRKAAHALYNSDIIHSVLARIYEAIEKNKIEIRQDRNVHLDLSLQSKVMSLLLSYNPLWLRIALETIYGEKLKLTSNSDMLGLSKFLYERFFKDRLLIRKHKSVHNPKYNIDIKKLMLKKYFSIVYFLDKAKINCLIRHDPCLFRRNSTVKESREMLIQFTRDAITAAVGDITKYLKHFGYFVEHKQDYIHEFDYAVNNLGGDLRDGVRLTKVMELILLRNDITRNLRVPAISKLQKIHNVKLVFEALAEAGCKIQHDIEPHHIVEGHREKNLSFLWQIIYKFDAPLVIQTAKIIQNWWRSLPVYTKRLKLQRQYQAKVKAASKIQRWYRHQKQAKEMLLIASCYTQYLKERKREKSAIFIQSFYRMYRQQKIYIRIRNTIINLQKQCKLWLQNVCYRHRESAAITIQKNLKAYLARNKFLQMKHSVIIIEKYVLAKKLMLAQQQQYMQIKSSAIRIQTWYRSTILMRKTRSEYLELKSAVCMLQTRYRSKLLMKKVYDEYIAVKSSTILIQRWFRSTLKMHSLRKEFLNLKKAVISMENRYIAQKKMILARGEYLQLRSCTLIIQSHLRATLQMRNDYNYYLSLKKAVSFVKSKYKANKLMLMEREYFRNLKKASLFIQTRFRSNELMKIQRHSYLQLKQSTVTIQNFFRGYLLMKDTRKKFVEIKVKTIKIQQKYRAYKSMCFAKNEYQKIRNAVILVQTKYRAIKAMRKERQEFLRKKNSCIIIQRYFRGFSLMRKEKQEYLLLKSVSCFIQQKYRAQLAMRVCREKYLNILKACSIIQNKFRANKLMQNERTKYQKLKKAVRVVESRYIANKNMIINRDEYLNFRYYTVFIQRIYRANQMMKIERNLYLERRNMAIKIQKYVRGYLLMKKEKQSYLTFRISAIKIQQWFRAQKNMIQTREYYQRLQHTVLFVQQMFKANKLMKEERNLYEAKRSASICIQKYYRSYLLMKKTRIEYLVLRKSTITIQQRYIAYKKMCSQRNYYLSLKKYVIIIQRRYRSNKLMLAQRSKYLKQRESCVLLQNYYRSYLLMKRERHSYLTLKTTVKFIQEIYRAKKSMEISRQSFLKLKQIVMYIQRKFRANQAVALQRTIFLQQREAAVKIQKYFRGYQLMKRDRKHFLSLMSNIVTIQKYARGFLTRRKYSHLLTPEAKEERRIKKAQEAAATKVQVDFFIYLKCLQLTFLKSISQSVEISYM